MQLCKTIPAIAALLGSVALGAARAESTELELKGRFADTVHPFLETYCFACHNAEKQKGKLDLSRFTTSEAVAGEDRLWETLRKKLEAEKMPPEDAERQPPAELRRSVLDWIRLARRHEAERSAGDPGPVLSRRLSASEYDLTIRDLTGVDLRPARDFPVDPANEAGFDNSGESLAMSATLLKKYLEAARRVAEHLVLKPKGLAFAPHPVVTETERDQYCVKRIVDFYARQPAELADYFLAAWRFENRAALGTPEATLAGIAAEAKLSAKYLETVWSILAGPEEEIGPIAALRGMWRKLPASSRGDPAPLRRGCERMRDFVFRIRRKLQPEIKNLAIPGIAPGSQPFVLWKDRQFAANRRHSPGAGPRSEGERGPLGGPEKKNPPDDLAERALAVPTDEAARRRFERGLERFCEVFPDAFFIAERGLIFLDEDKESVGRLLSAGFHLMVGYFRDDGPLYDLILDEAKRRELDALWQELHFLTLDPQRQYKDFIFFERAEPPRFLQGAEFDFARSEDQDSTSEAKIRRLADAYLAKARRNCPRSEGGADAAIGAIEDYFMNISSEIRSVEAARAAAEPSHLEALLAFAERAYRRPLSTAERRELLAFYDSLRKQEGLSHEEALRDLVASVLMSPSFCYRIDLAGEDAAPDAGAPPAAEAPGLSTTPLSDYDLASRLSYFLWSSMPDEALLARAAAGELHRSEVLAAEARRMLRDDRVRGLATEFGGNWLDFRRFEEHNGVDRGRFQSFTNELRQSMFEEPIRFFIDLVREDRSVLDFLYADRTFVDRLLARHYGMEDIPIPEHGWACVDGARRYGRGGLLPMAVFLTKNAPGLRTSPVKRGYWVIRRLLGEIVPPPPPKVPELPDDEKKLGEITLREALARHRQDKNCAGCHERFDAIGLVFEGYGPIGERRALDFGGRPVETRAAFPGGGEGEGLDGLRAYLRERREKEFLDNLCRKLLSFALGRSLILSDDLLIEEMRAKLAEEGFRFGALVEKIVTSPQFLRRRGRGTIEK